MRKSFVLLAALFLTMAMAFTSCSTDAGGDNPIVGGKLTITDIPAAAIGSYIAGWASVPLPSTKALFFTAKAPGLMDEDKITGVQITGDTVTLNVYLLDIDEDHPVLYAPYTGSHTTDYVIIYRNSSAIIEYGDAHNFTWVGTSDEPLDFTNGSATISYSDLILTP